MLFSFLRLAFFASTRCFPFSASPTTTEDRHSNGGAINVLASEELKKVYVMWRSPRRKSWSLLPSRTIPNPGRNGNLHSCKIQEEFSKTIEVFRKAFHETILGQPRPFRVFWLLLSGLCQTQNHLTVRRVVWTHRPNTFESTAMHLPSLSRYFCKSMPSSWQSVVFTPPFCITMQLPFLSRYFWRGTRVRGCWNIPNTGHWGATSLKHQWA